MYFNHNPSHNQAASLRKNNSESLLSSLSYIYDVCEDILDEDSKIRFPVFLSKLEDRAYTSGFFFYLAGEIGKSIERENLNEIKLLFSLILNFDIDNKRDVIIGNKLFMGEALFDFYKEIKDDKYNFLCDEVCVSSKDVIERNIDKALHTIRTVDGELFKEVNEIVDEFYVFKIKGSLIKETVFSGSSFYKLGTVLINEEIFKQDDLFIVDKIIHESAHQILLSIMIQDEIILNPDSERYPSPIRKEPRTMNGVYHAAFVLYRLSAFFKKMVDVNSAASSHLLKNITLFDDCYGVIKKHAILTDAGINFIENCNNDIQAIKNEF